MPSIESRSTQLANVLVLMFGTCVLSMGGADAAMALTLTSSAFKSGAPIPSLYTCEGKDISPPLAWEGAPAGTKSLALIVDDPDAPDPRAPKRVWVHWLLYNIPPDASALAENADKGGLPAGTARGVADSRKAAYGGPCPPIGRHRYFHKPYALDTTLGLAQATKAELEAAMKGHVLAQAELIGTYQKSHR
jgi:Raf kinase inhibitor-like YbhB/YbcL family protein